MREYLNITNECNLELMKRYEDNHFDLAIVDPPYGIGMDNSKKRTKPDRPNSYTELYKDFRYHKTDWDNEIPTQEYFNELFRVSKNQIIWGANYMCNMLPNRFGWIYWNKNNGDNNNFSDGEFAFSSKGIQSRHFKCSAFDKLRGGKDRIHPTQKPDLLYQWLLTNYAEPNYKILDTHLGSGSIAIALDSVNKIEKMNLTLTACEIDKTYFNKAIERIEEQTKWNSLF